MFLPLLMLVGAATVSAGGHCANCNLTLKGEIRTKEVLSGIQAKMGFDPSGVPKIPAEVLSKAMNVARQASLHDDQDDKVVKEEVHVFGTEVDEEDANAARFKFNNDTKNRRIERADIYLFLAKPESSPGRRDVSINVYESVEDGMKGELLASHRVLSPSHGHSHHRVRLNSAAMERLTQHNEAKLIVEAMLDGENLVVLPGDKDEKDHPISLSLISAESTRVRRHNDRCKIHEPVQKCCVFERVIDFKELGWDTVIAPSKMIVTGCAGFCPGRGKLVDKTGAPSGEAVTESAGISYSGCCHPTDYEDMMMVYITPNHNIVVSVVKNMLVAQCSCN